MGRFYIIPPRMPKGQQGALKNSSECHPEPPRGAGEGSPRYGKRDAWVLRYLTNDVPVQADAVEGLLNRASDGETVLVINTLVIAEIVWTLESYYGLARDSIKDKILAILNTPGIEAAEGDLLLQAIFWCADQNIDFVDAFNAVWALAEALATTYTFDRKHLSRIEGIRVQVPGE